MPNKKTNNIYQMKTFIITILLAVAATTSWAQTKVKGHIINERGESIEYVSIGFDEDSVSVVSDAKGHFELTIPQGRRNDLSFTHVSYQTKEIPYQEYANGRELTVVLTEKLVELAEVTIGKHSKPKTIASKNLSGPTTSIRGKGKPNSIEWGPVFKSKRNYAVSDILLTIKSSSFQWCVLSFNIYKIQGNRFVNILNKPIYYRLDKPCGKQRIAIQPEETIMLKGKQKYYISVSVVDSDRYGILEMQSQFKTSYARSLAKGKKRKLPVGPAIVIKGYEAE